MRFLKAQTTSRGINSDTKGFNIDSLGLANINTDKAVIVPKGTQNQRPYTGVEGMLRYNSDTNDFEVFIVDGKYRRECINHIVNLEVEGRGRGVMIILDNSDRYPNTLKFLQEKLGWMQIDFHGFGPINSYTWTTSILMNPVRYSKLCYSNALKSECALGTAAKDDY